MTYESMFCQYDYLNPRRRTPRLEPTFGTKLVMPMQDAKIAKTLITYPLKKIFNRFLLEFKPYSITID